MKLYHIQGAPPLYTNTFLVIGENGRAAAIDPAAPAGTYEKLLAQEGAALTHILLTHGHYDHVDTVGALRERTGARVYLDPHDCKGDRLFPLTEADCDYTDGERIEVDTDVIFRVIATPGHSEGSVCLLGEGVLFAGDTLFAGGVGRTDLAGGSPVAQRRSLEKLCAAVEQNVQVLPGHEAFSTMDEEKAHNPYLQF